ncbi:hypothetical protein LCGC14_0431100 [marine sediment metagenome]|uniref:Uncharacterized protein n=1 Tax=marine sediment metagenome TaxID=412755 RepID=A0A0F9SN17_9ZZZZ
MRLIAILLVIWIMMLATAFTAYTCWRQALGDGRFMWTETNQLIIWSEAIIFTAVIPVGLWLVVKRL